MGYNYLTITGVRKIVINNHIPSISGWWYTYPSEKYEFVSWDDEIPNRWNNKTITGV